MTTQKTVKLDDYYIRKNGETNDTATQSKNGLMSSSDKQKLDGISANANNYVHPNSYIAYSSGLYKITTDTNGHVISASAVQGSDLPAHTHNYAATDHTHSQYLTSHNPIDSSLSTTSTNAVQNKVVKSALDGKAASSHTHTKSQITDFPSTMTPNSHTHGNLQNDGIVKVSSTVQKSKNIVTDANGYITAEAKPAIPSASSTTPSADTASGSVGSGTTWAKADHTHPKSTLYAEAEHTHDQYLTSQDISSKADKTGGVSQITDTNAQNYQGINGWHVYTGSATQQEINSRIDETLGGKEDTNNKTSTLSSSSTTTQYPNAKAIYDTLISLSSTTKNGHTHSDYVNPTIIDNLTTNDASKVLSAKQGKILNDNKLDSSTASNTYLSKTDASSTYVAKENGKGLFTGSYNDLTDKPVIPSKTSDLANDSGYLTSHQDISGKVNVSDINNWQTINLTNGVLYFNETLRLCELHYSKTGISLSANTWKDIETIPQIASYPHKQEADHFYVSGNMPYYVVRIYRNGQIKAYSIQSTSIAVTFNVMWHY